VGDPAQQAVGGVVAAHAMFSTREDAGDVAHDSHTDPWRRADPAVTPPCAGVTVRAAARGPPAPIRPTPCRGVDGLELAGIVRGSLRR
jgi:hypothetical protein